MPPGKCPYLRRCDKYSELTAKIDKLEDTVERLAIENRRLRKENERLKDSRSGGAANPAQVLPFGSSTPSSKIPVKPNSTEEARSRVGGQPRGHRGHGRVAVRREDADEAVELPRPPACPDCGHVFSSWTARERTVDDTVPARRIRGVFTVFRAWCPRCGRHHESEVPGALPRFRLGNRLLAQTLVDHYAHGIPMSKLARRSDVRKAALGNAAHHIAELLRPAVSPLIKAFMAAQVKNADETPWPCDGRNGYAWGFFAADVSIHRLRGTRAATVPAEVFGGGRHRGVLCVDRYSAYNNSWKGRTQYCLEHFKRNLRDLLEASPGDPDCAAYIPRMPELFRDAMTLRRRKRGKKDEYDVESRAIRDELLAIAGRRVENKKLGEYLNLIRQKRDRFFQWVCHPEVPAENNLAERRLRPLVTARKVCFGSQSEKGLRTRETLMTIVNTLALRNDDPVAKLARTLDALARDGNADVAKLLWD